MIGYLDYLLGGVVFLIIFIPSIFLSLELLFGIFFKQSQHNVSADVSLDGVFVIIPAHNEELIIEDTLKKLQFELGCLNNVVVVADNCSDMTASIANGLGAQVVERQNEAQRGKGYALDAGVNHIRDLSPEVVIIFDADCEFVSGSFFNLVLCCKHNNSVVQSEYLMQAPASASVKTRVAEFAWLVKNKIRPQGLSLFNINCQLQGSGMAFPWRVFEHISFASGSIVEDLELGLKLNSLSERVAFDSSSKVISYFPESEIGTQTQRTRWEHGHLASIAMLPKAMLAALSKGNIRSLFTSLDAMIPPTVLWLMLVFTCLVASALVTFFGMYLPFYLSFIAFGSISLCLFLSWFCLGRNILPLRDFSAIFIYVLSKFNVYGSFLRGREKSWVRTDRGKKNDDN
ncbi:glycosyltransferase family 2 protein [Pseudoalteromonas sp. 2CM28B]|uniref:glycosyltransferase family 2 protein n=1 Tax=Pseudoalteromonas sp. 2CM28B TaxID=2929851 RepID=UPI0020C0166C|nr:glycosyltransferase family 2 protein [Pseudoalteromonas sp. 2CM28B]MCK8131484.1 glycosyltransferase [Pseudoalteromonas sp. 2CM28B]